MKKAVLLFMFLCVSVLCCFADESVKNDENNESSLFFIYSGLSTSLFGFNDDLVTQTSGLGFSVVNPVLSTSFHGWKQADLGLTKYADYKEKSFFETSIFKYGLMIGGLITMATAGILGASDANSNYIVNIIIFTLGLTATAGGIVLLIVD